jgi:hypothetical protein
MRTLTTSDLPRITNIICRHINKVVDALISGKYTDADITSIATLRFPYKNLILVTFNIRCSGQESVQVDLLVDLNTTNLKESLYDIAIIYADTKDSTIYVIGDPMPGLLRFPSLIAFNIVQQPETFKEFAKTMLLENEEFVKALRKIVISEVVR